MQVPDLNKITIDTIHEHLLANVRVDVLRLDKIHPVISGNKWFKLKFHLDNFDAGNYKGILTFGGPWSNHIVSTACACYLKKIGCIGIIRGEKPPQLSATLTDASNYGMHLKFISRETYRKKDDAEFFDSIAKEYSGYYIIPEGGSGPDGEKGAAGILGLLAENDYTHIVCAVGTGTMYRGIKKAAVNGQEVIGIVVLKGWQESSDPHENFFYNYHFGGYAKYTNELLSFMNEFYERTSVPTDFVYTGKLAFAMFDLLKKDRFQSGSKILMIHSGGLQGNASLQKGSLIF